MGIYQRQYSKVLAAEILKYLMLGKLPNLNDISQRISSALNNKSKITYKYIPQQYKEVFRNELYNKSLRNIKFDIDTFHEELIDLFAQASTRLNFADLYHKINSYDLKQLQAQLEMLLFTVDNADFYFSGAFDTFSDTSKMNLSESTKDIIDLSEQCISLPYKGNSTRRIAVNNLINLNEVDLKLNNEAIRVLVSSNQIPGSSFGNIFTDVLSVWAYEIITTENIPVDITFTVPLGGNNNIESEYFTSRFEVIPHILKKERIKISTSNDDVNYFSLLGYEEGIDLEDQKKTYAMDFETTLVQYIKINLSKQEADEEIIQGNTKQYRYLFGLKNLSAFATGRSNRATYVSLPFSFTDSTIINKLSIDVTDHIPPGCSIDYSVAVTDNTGSFLSSYIPISPFKGVSKAGVDKIISFGSTNELSNKFTVTTTGNDAPQSYGTAFQGKKFYRIGKAYSEDLVFGKSLLYRGYKAWYRDTTGSFEIINVNDNYVSFEQSDLEAMYALTTEVPGINYLGLGTDGIRRSQLTVTKPPYYDSSRGHTLKPQPGTQNSSLDTRPNYAVYKVLQKGVNARNTVTFSLGSSRTQYLPVSSFLIQSTVSSELPILRLTGTQILSIGVDYTFETVDIGGRLRPTGNIVIPNGSALLDSSGNVINYLLEFEYSFDPDITHKVSRIDGNLITLEHANLTNFSSIEITYRYIPVAPSQIIKSSIRVSNLPSTSGSRIFYVEGRDYILDAGTGAIQRIIGGDIPNDGSVYVQFSYRDSETNIQTFTTWCYINPTEGVQIKFDLDASTKKNKLIADSEVGEAFYINTNQGLINLTKASATPLLNRGWVQFIVRSKNPDANLVYRTNLIDQVIQLKDINKKKIFKQNNFYFGDIIAFREPLLEKTLNHLKVNTLLADHTVFAIDKITDPNYSYIVLNFQPNTTTELYNKVPTEDSDESNPPATSDEDFLFTYLSKVDSESAPSMVVVKIDLSRDQSIDGAITPKCLDYKIRVG